MGTLHRASRLTPHALRSSRGFTILEIIIVLFLLVGLLGIILPRISLDEIWALLAGGWSGLCDPFRAWPC